jgi:hypothetical protein
MINFGRTHRASAEKTLRELQNIPSSYPEKTPGRVFLDRDPKEALLVVRGAREAAQQFRTILLGFLQSWEHDDPKEFCETLPLLLRVVRDDLDYEAYPAVELIEQTTALYSNPCNANRPLTEILTLAMQNLNGGKRHDPESNSFLSRMQGK